jgi:hypothetical protein
MATEVEDYHHRPITLVGQGISFSREYGGDGVELEIEYPDRTDLAPDGTDERYVTISAEDWAAIVEHVKRAVVRGPDIVPPPTAMLPQQNPHRVIGYPGEESCECGPTGTFGLVSAADPRYLGGHVDREGWRHDPLRHADDCPRLAPA